MKTDETFNIALMTKKELMLEAMKLAKVNLEGIGDLKSDKYIGVAQCWNWQSTILAIYLALKEKQD